MPDIFDELPTRNDVGGLSATDMANRLLMSLAGDSLNRHNFLLRVQERYGQHDDVSKAYLAAWASLVSRGFLVEKGDPGWFFVSEAGEEEKKRLRLLPPTTSQRRVI